MEEYVLRGNSAILKCHIPSFVSEYVNVVSWIISEDSEEVEIKLDSTNSYNGTECVSLIISAILGYSLLIERVNCYKSRSGRIG